jgi:hypothetical protein
MSAADRESLKSVALPNTVSIPEMHFTNAGPYSSVKEEKQLDIIRRSVNFSLQNMILKEVENQLRAKNKFKIDKSSAYKMDIKINMHGYFIDVRPYAKIMKINEAKPNMDLQAAIYKDGNLVWRNRGYVTMLGPIPTYSLEEMRKNPGLMREQYQKMIALCVKEMFVTL